MPRDRRMNADEVETILQRYGFSLVSQKGSHRKWRNVERQLQVIVPYHKGRDLPIGTLRNIMISAAIPESEWKTEGGPAFLTANSGIKVNGSIEKPLMFTGMEIDQMGAISLQREAVMAAIATIKAKLPFLIDLNTDDRKALPKMGDKSRAFVSKAMEVAA